MNEQKLTIRFVIIKAKQNKQGKCPLHCRLTYNHKRKQFAIGQFVKYSEWDSKRQIAEHQLINTQLELVKSKIQSAYLKLQLQGEVFNIDDIYGLYLGKETGSNSIHGTLEYFEGYLLQLKSLVGKDIAQSTYEKYNYVYDQTKDFIQWKYAKSDISLDKLNLKFLHDFEHYLKTERNQAQVTINKVIQRFRKPVRLALSEGIITIDPFHAYKPKRVKKEVVFLSAEELKTLENFDFTQPRLEYVRDLFVFSCYTGLPYNEVMSLKLEHIQTSFDNQLWIFIYRKKTSGKLSIPLLRQALQLIEKYRSENDRVFPRISNQKVNSYLKEIADIVGIKKRITHHMARKTFASTVLLYNDVPMEIVSELLGHSSVRITEGYYGKIVNRSISNHIRILKKRLK